jgi:uncharacterized membrane protein YeaQ/YmgE (transglycosylase-associated protein family)
MVLLDVALNPGNWAIWILVGLIAGAIASYVVRGSGYGIPGDLIFGLIGAVIGGWVAGFFFSGTYGFLGTLIISILGAILVLWILRLFSRKRSSAPRT